MSNKHGPATSNAQGYGGVRPAAELVQPCPIRESQRDKSIHIDVGWAFTGAAPGGEYTLDLPGGPFEGQLGPDGSIRIDEQLDSVCGDGSLEIRVTNGPVFSADVTLDLPAIQTPAGVTRRLTNLGWPAGTSDTFDERSGWAIRAFKRAIMNGFTRNAAEEESTIATRAFQEALRDAYGGAHPDDNIRADLGAVVGAGAVAAQAFGHTTLLRSSFERHGALDDRDAEGAGDQGIWGGQMADGQQAMIAGGLRLYLRAFDPGLGEAPITNKVKLPQFVRLTQFVLWELGFWMVGGRGAGRSQWTREGGLETRLAFEPDGIFGRHTQWAVREFQCWAKSDHAAREIAGGAERRYVHRLLAESPQVVNGAARYPDDAPVSGAINEATRNALDAWATQRLRCPVLVYSSRDTTNVAGSGSDLDEIERENLWLHDDEHDAPNRDPRIFVLDWSDVYSSRMPANRTGTVNARGAAVPGVQIPRPIVVGDFSASNDGGPRTARGHCWDSTDTEVVPGVLIGTGGLDGAGLTASQLSTFKVVRVAAHFECYGFMDCLNAYDNVCISLPPYHWTLCLTTPSPPPQQTPPDEPRELAAVLAKFLNDDADAYHRDFGRFGLHPELNWGQIQMTADTGTYTCRIAIDIEGGTHNLAGATGTDRDRCEDNQYCKTWHTYYRFQMASRTSAELHAVCWDMARRRIRDILDKTFTITNAQGQPIQVRTGDYATSEKAVALLLRWHIYRPGHLFRVPGQRSPNHLLEIMERLVANPHHTQATQQREDDVIAEIVAEASAQVVGAGPARHLQLISNWNAVPGANLLPGQYHLNLNDDTLSDQLNSFDLEAP